MNYKVQNLLLFQKITIERADGINTVHSASIKKFSTKTAEKSKRETF